MPVSLATSFKQDPTSLSQTTELLIDLEPRNLDRIEQSIKTLSKHFADQGQTMTLIENFWGEDQFLPCQWIKIDAPISIQAFKREAKKALGETAAITRVETNAGFATDLPIAGSLLGAEPPQIDEAALLNPNTEVTCDLWYLGAVNASAAWPLGTGNRNQVVAVIDSGVFAGHKALKQNVLEYQGFNALDPTSSSNDTLFHGTFCASVIGATGGLGVPLIGVNWKVSILPIKIVNGIRDFISVGVTLRAFRYVWQRKNAGLNIVATSNSWVNDPFTHHSSFQSQAIDRLGAAGIVNVFASGDAAIHDNDSAPFYPCSYTCESIVAVTGSSRENELDPNACFGAKSVDLAAPSVSIIGAQPSPAQLGGIFASNSGTSFSTPLVAGAIALISSHEDFPGQLSVKEKISCILEGVRRYEGLESKCVTGGVLNISQSVSLAVESLKNMRVTEADRARPKNIPKI